MRIKFPAAVIVASLWFIAASLPTGVERVRTAPISKSA
jgi:hypothetical protein